MSKSLTVDNITPNALQQVTITSDQTETLKKVIPMNVATKTVKMLDVTTLSDDEQKEMELYVQHYNKYLKGLVALPFSFEDFIELSHNKKIVPNWLYVEQA